MFIVARITSVDVDVDTGDATIFGVSDGLRNSSTRVYSRPSLRRGICFLDVAYCTSSFPVAFLSSR
jgi:hypothetical protein